MMSMESIRALSDAAAAKAARRNKKPYAIFDEAEVDGYVNGATVPFPNLGSYMPPGFRLVESLFVDKSGMGLESEPAMTHAAFFRRLRHDVVEKGNPYFYAIVEEGPFQVYIGVFESVGDTIAPPPPPPETPRTPSRGHCASSTSRDTPVAKRAANGEVILNGKRVDISQKGGAE
jgi:hypothetical protein